MEEEEEEGEGRVHVRDGNSAPCWANVELLIIKGNMKEKRELV